MVGIEKTGDVKNSIGNGEVKELIYMTHGHELTGGLLEGKGVPGGGGQRGKYWDNCNSIINKTYLKKRIGIYIYLQMRKQIR